jgi:hypothetical protein
LAYLLPIDQRTDSSAQTAQFNSRTGRFTANDYAYTVDHLAEWNRAKRMSMQYFDVDAWERQRAEEFAKRKRDEENGVGSSVKEVTKKDMVRVQLAPVTPKHGPDSQLMKHRFDTRKRRRRERRNRKRG